MTTSGISTVSFFRSAAMAFAVAASFAAAPASADPAAIGGTWSGGGSIILPSGAVEKARCRATFRQAGSGAFMDATCATASARVSQQAELSRVGANRYSGDFRNPDFGISGSIRVTVNGNSLSAALNGGGGSAHFTLGR
jgi:hypothetical protein